MLRGWYERKGKGKVKAKARVKATRKGSPTAPAVASGSSLFPGVRVDLFAPATEDQLKVGVTDTPLAPLAGEIKFGAGSGVVRVVKLHLSDQVPYWVGLRP